MNFDTSVIAAYWSQQGIIKDNWDDKLNPALILGLAKMPVANVHGLLGWEDRPSFMVIGSCLRMATPQTMVWGTGFLHNRDQLARPPFSVFAVRGPRTRRKLVEMAIPCPEVYGDPALLYPLLYPVKPEKKYKYGAIHHIREIDVVKQVDINTEDSVIHIDIRGGLKEVVDKITSCEVIISSSLHGVICAHAYGVDGYWMKPSDLPLGDDFKFNDYFESIGFGETAPLPVADGGLMDPALLRRQTAPPRIDGDALIDACPFISAPRKKELRDWRSRLAQRGHRGAIFN